MGAQVYRNQIIVHVVVYDLDPYCVRHTFCTDLQTAGVPINVAKEFMEHSDIALTSKTYTHHSEESFINAAKSINRFHEPERKYNNIKRIIKHH